MPIGPPTANPYYDDFAEANGMDPSLAAKWKAAVMPPGGIIDRGRQLASKYLDASAPTLQKLGEAGMQASPIPGSSLIPMGLNAAGITAPRVADAIRSPPRDEASTPAFQRAPELGAPYQEPRPAAGAGMGLGAAAGGAPGVVSTKESEITTTHKGHAVSDAVRDAADQAHVDARLANQLGLEAAQEKGHAAGMAAAIQANAVQAYNALEQKEQARRDQAIRAQQSQLAQDVDAVRSGAVDPNKYLNEMGIGSKIFAMIGLALGGGLAARNGGPNVVAQQLNQQIANSIQTQETNLANKRQAVGARQGLIEQMRQQYGDESKARLASHMMLLEGVRNQLQAASTNITDKDAQAHAAAVDAQLGKEQAQLQAQFDKQAQDDVTVQSQDVYMSKTGGKFGGGAGGGGGIGGLGKHGDAATKDLSENLAKSGIPQANAQLAAIDHALSGVKGDDIPGVGGIHRIAQLAGGSAEKLDNLGYSLFGSEKGQEIRQAVQNLENGILKDQSGAAVSDQELMRFKQAMAGARDAASFRRGLEGYRNRIREIEATVRSGFAPQINDVQRARAQAYGSGGAASEPTKVNPIR